MTLTLLGTLSEQATNAFAFWTFALLFSARLSAKLNLFFGVPHINTQFLPRPLSHLASHFRQAPVTGFFPFTISVLTIAAALLGERPWNAPTAADSVGFALLLSMLLLAKLRARLDRLGIPHMENDSHIIPVMIGDPVKCRQISDILMQDWGIYVQPINDPAVPKGTERMRITPSPYHSDADIDHLCTALSSLWRQCAFSHAVA
jgi:hypothetical protein